MEEAVIGVGIADAAVVVGDLQDMGCLVRRIIQQQGIEAERIVPAGGELVENAVGAGLLELRGVDAGPDGAILRGIRPGIDARGLGNEGIVKIDGGGAGLRGPMDDGEVSDGAHGTRGTGLGTRGPGKC
jgi:hypothetical protein